MTGFLILITALIFFFLGRFARTTHASDELDTSIEALITKTKNTVRKPHPKAGILPFKQPEDFEPEAIQDKALEEQWIKSGIADEVTRQ